jgi:hypothetical protein
VNKDIEGQFEELAANFIEEAEEIDCSKPDFAQGLELLIEKLQERLGSVRDEIGEG